VIRLDGVSVTLGGAQVLDDVTASVDDGEWVGVIGPNGAGKTTLLRAVAGLAPHDGTIEIGRRAVSSLKRRELSRRVALVPHDPLMPKEMTVAEYVLLGRTPYVPYLGSESRSDVDAVEGALERLDLTALASRRLGTLSGGERQRAVLARALAQETGVLLLDEPTSALDVGRQQQVLEFVDRLRAEERLTILSAMHDLTLAAQFADRLVLLDRGAVVADGAPRDVVTEARVAAHYGATVRIVEDEGGLSVVPTRQLASQRRSGAAL
jgi:iron complex transport system ATP-binding protein